MQAACKPELEKEFKAEYRDLESLLQESDFVCLVVPLTAALSGNRPQDLVNPEVWKG